MFHLLTKIGIHPAFLWSFIFYLSASHTHTKKKNVRLDGQEGGGGGVGEGPVLSNVLGFECDGGNFLNIYLHEEPQPISVIVYD